MTDASSFASPPVEIEEGSWQWKIIKQYFDEDRYRLTRHHLQSYNDMVNVKIPLLIHDKNKLPHQGGECVYQPPAASDASSGSDGDERGVRVYMFMGKNHEDVVHAHRSAYRHSCSRATVHDDGSKLKIVNAKKSAYKLALTRTEAWDVEMMLNAAYPEEQHVAVADDLFAFHQHHARAPTRLMVSPAVFAILQACLAANTSPALAQAMDNTTRSGGGRRAHDAHGVVASEPHQHFLALLAAPPTSDYPLRIHLQQPVIAAGSLFLLRRYEKTDRERGRRHMLTRVKSDSALVVRDRRLQNVRVRAASCGPVDLASSSTTMVRTMDGVTLEPGDHILLQHQTVPTQNGTYAVADKDAALRRIEGCDHLGCVRVSEGKRFGRRCVLCPHGEQEEFVVSTTPCFFGRILESQHAGYVKEADAQRVLAKYTTARAAVLQQRSGGAIKLLPTGSVVWAVESHASTTATDESVAQSSSKWQLLESDARDDGTPENEHSSTVETLHFVHMGPSDAQLHRADDGAAAAPAHTTREFQLDATRAEALLTRVPWGHVMTPNYARMNNLTYQMNITADYLFVLTERIKYLQPKAVVLVFPD